MDAFLYKSKVAFPFRGVPLFSKETVILLGLSPELNVRELEELLGSAAYSLPKNNHYDLIIRFCFVNRIYDIISVNELLAEYSCRLFNY